MMYLPRLCEHCLNPTCVASCPSGAIYKREEDGIVLIDQDKCRGWRMCISGCPYKKIYFNWKSGKSEKCIFCYPRIESGMPTICSETCVGRIRYLGVLLYDADRISEVASTPSEQDLYQKQLSIFLDPNDPEVIRQALKDGVPQSVINAAQKSPVYKLACDWQLALPLHPEYRTLPMVWYVPPLSPIQHAAEEGFIGMDGVIPDVESLRIPVKYLANMLTAGDERPVVLALRRLLAMRAYKRSEHVERKKDLEVLSKVGLSEQQVEDMYRYLAIANYEDRYVIPTAHREEAILDTYGEPSLLLFEHVHGDSRDRGQAMVDLMAVYERAGFAINVRELPDYLPLYLEFLSQRPVEVIRDGLQEVAHILRLLATRLNERQSPYACLFETLLTIAGVAQHDAALQAQVAKESRDDTLEALDRVWEEEMVTFMGDDATASCSVNRPVPTGRVDQTAPVHWVNAGKSKVSSEGFRPDARAS